MDTEEFNLQTLQDTLAEFGFHLPMEWLRSGPVNTFPSLRARLLRDQGRDVPCSNSELARRWFRHWGAHCFRLQGGPAAETARRLARAGMPLAVVTANYTALARTGLAVTGLSGLFRFVVAREHVRNVKPAPDAYLLAADLLKVPPQRCVAYENSDRGVRAAVAAGVNVVDIRREGPEGIFPLFPCSPPAQ